jgi:hypothetical protein
MNLIIKNSTQLLDRTFKDVMDISTKKNHKKAVLKSMTIQQIYDEEGTTENSIGIRAYAEIWIPFEVITNNGKQINFHTQRLYSAGLWDIDPGNGSLEDIQYLKDIGREEVETLQSELKMLNVIQDFKIIIK